MTKEFSKAIMQRSKLKNEFNKCPSDENSRLYKQQRNYCTNLLAREKKNYFNNLDLKIFKDNKTFWQRVKPLFSDKKSVICTKEEEVAEKLNNFFYRCCRQFRN